VAGFSEVTKKYRHWLVVAFIAIGLVFFLSLGQAPATLLVLAGALNGLILPVGLGLVLWAAARRRDLLRGYRYPKWLLAVGVLAWGLTIYLGWQSLGGLGELWS
jgi:Mn2+/Fe2+ NRAMP family transporter